MYTLLYLKWTPNRDLLHSTGNSAQCSVAAGMGAEPGREWIYVYAWLSPFAAITTLSTGHTPIKNKAFLKKISGMKGYTQGPIQPIRKEVASCCIALEGCSLASGHV